MSSQMLQIATLSVPEINQVLSIIHARFVMRLNEREVDILTLRKRIDVLEAQVASLTNQTTRRTT